MATNGTRLDVPTPLKIVIAGAGVGGLSAAIALRQSGHEVEVYESSRFATETGAAIHLPSNVNGLVRRYGMVPEELGANLCEWVSEYKKNGEQIYLRPTAMAQKMYVHPWQLIHRIDLHNALKDLATQEKGKGKPVVIHLQSKVASVDVNAPTLTLIDGKVIKADLIIGADGVHSITRKFVLGHEANATPSGSSAYRFLVKVADVKANPKTAHLIKMNGELKMWGTADGGGRTVVTYPCRDNTELNFVCIHGDRNSDGPASEDWNNAASKKELLEVYSDFHPDVLELLGMAEESTLKLWKLLDREQLKTWINGKCALIGDAAHPFLPHQGQGGAQAIEDGCSIGALFPLETLPEEVEERLNLYMEARYERASRVQSFTRQVYHHTKGISPAGEVLDFMKFTNFNFDHDAHDYAQTILLRHLASKAKFRRMPASFGASPGPRQDHLGKPRTMAGATYTTAYVTFKTPKTYLTSLLPSSDFKIDVMGGWAKATFSATKLGNLSWLGGRGYSMFGLYVHDVSYTGKSGEATSKADFLPVLFENKADPIITGREELGFAKVFASLDDVLSGDLFELTAGWEETSFCTLKLGKLEDVATGEDVSEPATMHYKLIPSSTAAGEADAEYSTTFPALQRSKDEKNKKAGEATISWTELEGAELFQAFPTLGHIIERLRGVEVTTVLESGVRVLA